MYINKKEQELLQELHKVLVGSDLRLTHLPLVFGLGELNRKLSIQRGVQNEKAWLKIKEKRKVDPNYGRPEKEWRKE